MSADTIPEWAIEQARQVRAEGHQSSDWFLEEPHVLAIAKAIHEAVMAERERCLGECDYVLENIRVGKTERKRFDMWDLNQTFKGAVKCVRERIEGDWEKNWRPDPDAAPKAEG